MTLSTIYKIFGGLPVLMGVLMLGGLAPLPVDWAASVGLTTLAEHFGSTMMVIGFIFGCYQAGPLMNSLKVLPCH